MMQHARFRAYLARFVHDDALQADQAADAGPGAGRLEDQQPPSYEGRESSVEAPSASGFANRPPQR